MESSATPPHDLAALLAPGVLARLERLVELARRAAPPRRRRALRRPGRGIEPGGRRDYAAGDDIRLVDWPAYARLERLLIKVQEELPEPRLELVLDGSGSMAGGAPSPALRAALAAAALAAAATAREVRASVWWAGEPAARLALHRPGELVRLLRFLAARRPVGPSALERTARLVADREAARGGAVVLSDGLDPAASGAAALLRARGFDALVVLCGASAELDPAAAGEALETGELELIDRETGARRRLQVGPLALAEAVRARAARAGEVERQLAAAGIPCDRVAPDAPFEAAAWGLLR